MNDLVSVESNEAPISTADIQKCHNNNPSITLTRSTKSSGEELNDVLHNEPLAYTGHFKVIRRIEYKMFSF